MVRAEERPSPQALLCEGVARSGLEVALKSFGLALAGESYIGHEAPWEMFGSVGGGAGIVSLDAGPKVSRAPDIALSAMAEALEQIDVVQRRSFFAEASKGTLLRNQRGGNPAKPEDDRGTSALLR